MEKSRITMIRSLLDQVPDEPTATEATAIAVQLNRIEGYLSRDMVSTIERAVVDAQAPLLKRIDGLETAVRELIAAMESMATETAKSNLALESIATAIHSADEDHHPRPADKSVLKKLKHWVEEGE